MKGLDVVRTPDGNIGVVVRVDRKQFSLTFTSTKVNEKSAWWTADEVEFLFNVAEMVEVLNTDTIKELIRLRSKTNE